MAESALMPETRNHSSTPATSQGFDRLQELMRHGYVPDHRPLSGSAGLLLRHQFAPDLILRPDGSVDVPLGQKLKFAPAPVTAKPPKRKRRWLRGFLIIVGLALYTLFAFAIIAATMESM